MQNANDTQLFFSFYPSDLDANITLPHNALQHTSSRMTGNLLTLNLKNRIFSHWTQATTSQILQLPDRNHPLRLQSRHNLR